MKYDKWSEMKSRDWFWNFQMFEQKFVCRQSFNELQQKYRKSQIKKMAENHLDFHTF